MIRDWLGKAVGKEGETLDRHDRWLCMMYPRLALLREVLAKDGAIFICLWKSGGGAPSFKQFLRDASGMVQNTWWPQEDAGHTDEAKMENEKRNSSLFKPLIVLIFHGHH